MIPKEQSRLQVLNSLAEEQMTLDQAAELMGVTSRTVIPSARQARRTRRYTSTLYIHSTIRKVEYNPIDGGGRYRIQLPFVSNLPPTRSTSPPPITLTHTLGVPHKMWSYKSMTVRYVTGMLTHIQAHFDLYGRTEAGRVKVDLESLDDVPDDDLLELTASLMTYHLRQAGKLDTVSRGTVASPPDPLEVREMLTGDKVVEARP